MKFTVDILFSGFSGRLENCALGWGTWALIRDGTHKILLDTGNVGLRQNYDSILKKYGLTRSDIDIIFLTHLHFDHACNVDLFPDATFILSKHEWEYANSAERPDLFIQNGTVEFLRHAKKRFVQSDNEEIIPEVTTLLSPGHTPGCLSFILHQDNGEKWTLAGDAVKNRGELQFGEVQMSLDPQASAASIHKIRSISDRILPGHDGWISIQNGKIYPEGGNDKKLTFGQGVTINNGLAKLNLHMD